MKVLLLLFALVSLSFCIPVQIGTCFLKATTAGGNIAGTVKFTVTGNLVTIDANITGVATDGQYGMHIHQYGDITTSTGSGAGAHWNPLNSNHSCPTDTDRHMGDMGNWDAVSGNVVQTKSLDIIALTGTGSIIGRGVIFHGVTDDCVTQPAGGNAPPRYAQCVIGLANPGAGNGNVARASDGVTGAVCVLSATTGNTVAGTIYFDQPTPTSPTRVYGSITGLDNLPHGFHVHEFGDISNATGGAAGSHYNPLGANHGIPPFAVRHIGDMGNIYYYSSQVGYYDYTNNLMSLSGEYSILGHTVIIHATRDDCTMPVGNAGSRWAQCIIGVRNPVTVPVTLPGGVPTTQDPATCEALYPATLPPTEDGSLAASTSVGFALVLLAMIFAALF